MYFRKSLLFYLALFFMGTPFLKAQGDGGEGETCSISKISHSFTCDDNGTTVHTDDIYYIKAFYVNSATNSFWDQTYGPFPANTPQTITATDQNDFSCTKNFNISNQPQFCAEAPDVYWNNCVSLIESDGCTHLFQITVEGNDAFKEFPISLMKMNFNILGDGFITDAYFETPSIMEDAGVSLLIQPGNKHLTVHYFDNDEMVGRDMLGIQIFVVIQAQNPPSCFVFYRNGINRVHDVFGSQQLYEAQGECEPIQACSDGNTVKGRVWGFNNFSNPCPNTEEYGIMGAEISISGQTESCETTTLINGKFECNLKCDEGAYDVCVTTTCIDEPCGLDPLDVILMRQALLGQVPWQCQYAFMGDVNGDGIFTTYDILLVQKEILGIPHPPIDWCRFVPLDDYLNCCYSSPYTPCQYNSIDNCITVQDASSEIFFFRFIRGDFNGGCNDCIHGDGQGPFPLVVGNNENNIELKLPVTDTIYSLTLDVNIGENIMVGDISCNLPNSEYIIENGRLKLIWIDLSKDNTGYIVNPNIPLLTIKYQNINEFSLNEEGNYILSSQQGIKELTTDNSLSYRNTNQYSILVDNCFSYFEFKGKNNNGTVEIYNINGKRIFSNKYNFETGTVNVNANIQNSGIYLVHIKNNDNNITKKIFINK